MGALDLEISVVIPIKDRPIQLENLLSCLFKQSLDREKYEVLVVSNCSTQSLDDICSKYDARMITANIKANSYHARNQG